MVPGFPGAVSLVSTLVALAIVALIWNRQRYIRWLLIPLALWGLPDAILRLTTGNPIMAPVDSLEAFYLNGYQPISKVVSVMAVALLFTPRAHKWFSDRGK